MSKKIFLIVSGVIFIALLITAVGYVLINHDDRDVHKSGDNKLVVASPHPIEFMKPLINEFETETGIRAEVFQCGTSEAVERISAGEDIDILWGGSVLSVGGHSDLFDPYRTSYYDTFQDEFKNVPDGVTCFTDMPSILLVNTDLVGDIPIESYEDLLAPSLKGRIAYASPVKSSSSFEHLTNLLYAMGKGDPEEGWEFAEKFAKQLDGRLLDSSSLVYEGVASGKFVVGLTFEEAGITMMKKGRHVKIIYMKEGVVSTPDGIYINKNAVNPDQARIFIDFMTAYDTQKYISMDLGRRSVRSDIESSSLVMDKSEINLIEVDKNTVASKRDEWLRKFMSYAGEDSDEK